MPTNMWKWEVVPTRAVARDGNVRVLFEQRLQSGEDKGVLLAWCEGQYDPQVRKFHSMVLGVTASAETILAPLIPRVVARVLRVSVVKK